MIEVAAPAFGLRLAISPLVSGIYVFHLLSVLFVKMHLEEKQKRKRKERKKVKKKARKTEWLFVTR